MRRCLTPLISSMSRTRRRVRSPGLHDVRVRESGRYAAEITYDGRRRWLGTYYIPENPARAYDIEALRLGRLRFDMIFPLCPNIDEAEFLAPRVWVFSRNEEKENRMV